MSKLELIYTHLTLEQLEELRAIMAWYGIHSPSEMFRVLIRQEARRIYVQPDGRASELGKEIAG